MSSQLNPIGANILNLRPRAGSEDRSRLHGLYNFPSQGYPPNVAASVATINILPSPALGMMGTEVIGPIEITGGVEEFGANFYYHLLQETALIGESKVENSLSRMSEVVIGEIDALMAGKEDEEKPTAFAYSNARSVIESAYGKAFVQAKVLPNVPDVLPNPVATTDNAGGIRLFWCAGSKQIRLNFGATGNRKSYLYFEEDLPQGINHSVEPLDEDHLAARLAWLMGK